MVSELIGKYIWLIQTISSSGERGLSLDELSRKYERRFSQAYSRRTFNNHRLAVEDVFGISIECNRSTNRYHIPYFESALDKNDSVRWMIDTFTVGNLLSMGKERLSGRVSVEEVPSGQKYLTAIMQAMDEGRELEIEYSKYRSASSDLLHIQPFAVKEHERRWYLIGYCRERARGKREDNGDRDAWRVYGLDRIISLKETEESFRLPKDFDVDSLFYQSYGIFFPQKGQKAVTIRFRASEREASYLRDLPLHRSQEEEGDAPGGRGRIFRIRVIPNDNLIMEFCRHADGLEVLEPADIREAVHGKLENAARQYEDQ
ncbi:MAG: helix-turn-helix transcriptional regulator [Candidatus Cryptobacteroides sp.]